MNPIFTGFNRNMYNIAMSENQTLIKPFYFTSIDTIFNGRCYTMKVKEKFNKTTTLGKYIFLLKHFLMEMIVTILSHFEFDI